MEQEQSPPIIVSTPVMFGKTIDTTVQKMMNTDVIRMFSFYEKVSLLKQKIKI